MFNLAELFFFFSPILLSRLCFRFESFGRDGRTEPSESVAGNYTLSTPEMGGQPESTSLCSTIDSLRGSGEGKRKQVVIFMNLLTAREKQSGGGAKRGICGRVHGPCAVTCSYFFISEFSSFHRLSLILGPISH